jgi:transcriptional regulator with XRE-family HTH domain
MSIFSKSNFLRRLQNVAKLAHSRDALAKAMGISQTTLRNYLQGQAIPKADAIANLAYNLRINPAWLLLGSGNMLFKPYTTNEPEDVGNSLLGGFINELQDRFISPEEDGDDSPIWAMNKDPREALLDRVLSVLKEHGGSDEEIREAVRLILAGGENGSGPVASLRQFG